MFKKYKEQYYLLSEETPVTGDFVLTDNYGVWKFHSIPCPLPYWGNKNTCKKILKSTDLSINVDKFSNEEIKQYKQNYNE